jgi:hypothetical protein
MLQQLPRSLSRRPSAAHNSRRLSFPLGPPYALLPYILHRSMSARRVAGGAAIIEDASCSGSSLQTQPATLCRMRTPYPVQDALRPSNPSPPLLSPLAHLAPAFHGLLDPHGLLLSISRALLGWDLLALSAPSSRPSATSVPRARRPL